MAAILLPGLLRLIVSCRNRQALKQMTIESRQAQNRAVATWLLICCGLVFVMVVLGGFTRLTGSGLSMVDWRPLMGVLPPLSDAEWQRVFEM